MFRDFIRYFVIPMMLGIGCTLLITSGVSMASSIVAVIISILILTQIDREDN